MKSCEACGKGLEIIGLNRTYPPKRDPNGHAICPHCGALQSSADPRNAPATARGTLARIAEQTQGSNLPAVFSKLDYDALSPRQLKMLWAAEGCTCCEGAGAAYNPCPMHVCAGNPGSPTDERGLWLLKGSIRPTAPAMPLGALLNTLYGDAPGRKQWVLLCLDDEEDADDD
jgi:hypothetical protein